MNTAEVLATLKKLGKLQTAAIYRRHGSGDQVFGVLTSEIALYGMKLVRSPYVLRTGEGPASMALSPR